MHRIHIYNIIKLQTSVQKGQIKNYGMFSTVNPFIFTFTLIFIYKFPMKFFSYISSMDRILNILCARNLNKFNGNISNTGKD